jgi:hypothetical protein
MSAEEEQQGEQDNVADDDPFAELQKPVPGFQMLFVIRVAHTCAVAGISRHVNPQNLDCKAAGL